MTTTLIVGSKNYSSWSMRAGVAVTHAGLAHDEVVIPLGQEDTRERIMHFSPAGLVPVLIDDGTTVWDSLAILEFLAERCPDAHLWPAEPGARAVARSLCAEMHAGFAALRRELPMNCRRRYRNFQIGADAAKDIARICQVWRDARNTSGRSGDFLFGSFSAVDAMYAPVVSRFATYGVELDSVAGHYVEAVLDCPAVRQWIEEGEHEPVIERYELPD